jgi:peptide/nickel transport system ATP-binding protein
MGVVAQACDRVVVLYAGRIAETNTVDAVFTDPKHPYTRALIGCIPRHGQARGSLEGISGTVPSVIDYPAGCRFHPRCPVAIDLCRGTTPALERKTSGFAACHLAEA